MLGAQIAVGAAAIFGRFALEGAEPVVVSALRLSIAAVPVFVLSWHRSKALNIPPKHELLMACAGLALALHFGTWIASLRYTSIAVSTLLVCTVPVWTALYDATVEKKSVSLKFWGALAAGGAGVALIVLNGGVGRPPVAGHEVTGNILAVAGSIAFAFYLITIRSISRLYPTIVLIGRTYPWAAMSLIIAAWALHQSPPAASNIASWAGILGMSLFSQLLGHTGMNASLRWFSPGTVAFTTLLEPVLAAILAVLVFSEQLSPPMVIGAFVVLLAIASVLKLQSEEV